VELESASGITGTLGGARLLHEVEVDRCHLVGDAR
jgi:hypothetical protein